jgi:DNA adenine methylase
MNIAPKPKTPETSAPLPVKPPLKWAGGKRWLVPYLRPLWRQHAWRRLVEPFCGGLAVSLELRPQTALLNDANPHLINFYTWLQEGLTVNLPMQNESRLYYWYRERFNRLVAYGRINCQEAAELFYYLNRTGYNGLCRFNRKGLFNTPYGRHPTIHYTTDFSAYRAALAYWTLCRGDFAALSLQPDDFVYADPPYDVPFTQYSPLRFTWEDQVRAAEWLARHSGPVVLSNQATPRVVSLYRKLGYDLQFLSAPRKIACTGDRTPAREVIATRNL